MAIRISVRYWEGDDEESWVYLGEYPNQLEADIACSRHADVDRLARSYRGSTYRFVDTEATRQ